MLVKKRGNELKFIVYKNLTHAGHYRQFDWKHPASHKASVVSTLVSRATTICSLKTDRLNKKKETIVNDLEKIAYSSSFIEHIARCQG